MPTVLGLDVSLSMGRLVKGENGEEISLKSLATGGLSHLMDIVGANLKLEFTSLVSKMSRSTRKPTLWTLRKVSTRINLFGQALLLPVDFLFQESFLYT